MYGLIHNSLRTMVKTELGDHAWADIVEAAGLTEKDFLSLKSYDDSLVLSLLSATQAKTGRTIADLLHAFGKHFIKRTAYEHYAGVLNMHGATLWELLDNLNHMHDRIASSFPGFLPPSFELKARDDGAYELTYSSARQGLTAFVEGLLDGLADYFDLTLDVKVLSDTCSEEGQQTRFCLTTTEPK
ncbi:MAG: heme NO-binding domain-containing protein [Pseudohongiella sp.]|jgi:hypothetical protein|nr:heme NO-binding domain-containing protein [Pseudohongiella sp.]